MTRILLALLCLLASLGSAAITYTYGDFNKSAKTCTLKGWGGMQPTSGKLTLKETYTEEGVTYTVTAIAPNALDNLTEVTEITIPSGVVRIGEAAGVVYATGISFTMASCRNFNNCAKLERFKVASGNKAFTASGAGILMFKGGAAIVRVPEAIVVTDGTLKMSVSVTGIVPDAFLGNSTIARIALSPQVNLTGFDTDHYANNWGFWGMKKLKEFAVNGSAVPEEYSIVDGVLYNKKKTTIISFPPHKPVTSFTVPQTVKTIGTSAFRGASKLTSVSLGEVTKIRAYAFNGSGITSINISSKVTWFGTGVFGNCNSLTSLTLPEKVKIPEYFAIDCKSLTTVNLPKGAKDIDTGAFKGCSRLEKFPFNTKTRFFGDSIFAGCGFKTVCFEKGTVPAEDFDLGTAIFADNRQLTQIDLSQVKDNPANPMGFGIPILFASNCPKLRMVHFPNSCAFWGSSNSLRPNFGYNSDVEYIHIGSFSITDSPAIYYDRGEHHPTVYLLTTDAPSKSWPLCRFFQAANNSVCVPQVYCESYTLEVGDEPDEYVYPGGNYFIPGGTLDNYSAASEKARHMTEMYRFQPVNNGGKFVLGLSANIDGLVFTKVTANGSTDLGLPGSRGIIDTDIDYATIQTITVEYNLRGTPMKTVYPEIKASSGIKEAIADTPPTITVKGREVIFGQDAAYSVCDLSGKLLLTGRGTTADLSSLPTGAYVITSRDACGSSAVTKTILR